MRPAWKERLRRVIASTDELTATEEIVEAALHGTTPVADARPRDRRTLSGVLRAVTYSPTNARPELVAELYDGSGSIDVRWIGRRAIPGVVPGRRIVVTGRVSLADRHDRLVMYNPAYTLLAPASAS